MGSKLKVQGYFGTGAGRRGLTRRVSRSTRWHRLGRRIPEMFSNLIESGSHAADLKRRGRFFLGTTLFYGLLLAATGVGSIYAYNARLDYDPDYELVALMRFPPAEERSAEP